MEIAVTQATSEHLSKLASVAAQLLIAKQYDQLSESFGYALAFGRDTAQAIQTDLALCLTELGATGLAPCPAPEIKVSFFEPSPQLIALAECMLAAEPSGNVLLELVVTAKATHVHVTLEQLTAVA